MPINGGNCTVDTDCSAIGDDGGNGKRSFGNGVVFDNADLDIENKNPLYWGDFTQKLRQLYATDSKKKYINIITSASQPQPIEFSDQLTPDLLKSAWVDIAFIQFYNNPGYREYCLPSFHNVVESEFSVQSRFFGFTEGPDTMKM
ncbi:hypothetical protein BC936DRAFT_142880 [Jimgerdemannia flammicorona]|uniref:Chitinase n=1 Tax=Jimgerdemannia flammicorona TaxID=994334 RepID=A0A433DEP5_9FUNG|nr:hypothetical protein BC936DRAFT_142880 [Jimgerdemannia flammicorona]